MGRKLINKETCLQPAEYAEGHMSFRLNVTLNADANDPASLLAASLVAAAMRENYGQTEVQPILDPLCHTVTLCAYVVFDDLEEIDWTEQLAEKMEELWDEHGGVSDYNLAFNWLKEDIETRIANWVEETAETLDLDLSPDFSIMVYRFSIWQK